LVFRVAERMSLISDALFLEATAAEASRRKRVDATGGDASSLAHVGEEVEVSDIEPHEQARAIAQWIHDGRGETRTEAHASFPGLGWLSQPESFSDREWILAIAQEYRDLDRQGTVAKN
jgi:hypothetical protein